VSLITKTKLELSVGLFILEDDVDMVDDVIGNGCGRQL
jgi:hypothetical protein